MRVLVAAHLVEVDVEAVRGRLRARVRHAEAGEVRHGGAHSDVRGAGFGHGADPAAVEGAPTSIGAMSDATSFMWPRMHGSTDMTVLATSTWPSSSSGRVMVSRRKSSWVGIHLESADRMGA